MNAVKGKSAFLVMTLSVVALVLYVTLFRNIMTAFDTVRTYANISTFTALSTVVTIAPVVLLLAGIFAAGFGYYKGYKGAGAQDAAGIMRMVFGVILIILFLTLFSTILTQMYYLYIGGETANADFYPSYYTAFTTVVGIAPTILFLAGIFAGGATSVSGYRSYRRRRQARL